MEQTVTITEKEILEMFGGKKVKTASWIGEKGNRKIVIRIEKDE